MSLPSEYDDAYRALLDGLEMDDSWKAALGDHRSKWPGEAISSALVLTGPNLPRYVEPWADDEADTLGAYIFTDDVLVSIEVGAALGDDRHVGASSVPLVVESLDVTSDAAPWDNTIGSRPPWPGNLAAVVRVRGRKPIVIPQRPVTNHVFRESVQRVVAHLRTRMA